jgi:hypothetical protein
MEPKDTVFMRSPDGEIREVEATPAVLTPLMASGWHQHHMTPVAADPAGITGEPGHFEGEVR